MKNLLTLLVLYTSYTTSKCNLEEVYKWKTLKFSFPPGEEEAAAEKLRILIPEENIPMSIDVYKERLFVSVPKFGKGVLVSLAYLELSDASESPLLHPYPNWGAHIARKGLPEIRSAFRVRVDRCARLWVLDVDAMSDITQFHRLLIYDLHTDALLRSYDFPEDHIKDSTFFSTMAIEDKVCEDTFAFIGDLGSSALLVYSWKTDTSWRITHKYFEADLAADNFNVDGLNLPLVDGLYGLAVSGSDKNRESTLYFHPFTSYDEFSVNTKYLKDQNLVHSAKFRQHFKVLGRRENMGQAGASFIDPESNILFYGLVNLNSVYCWKISDDPRDFSRMQDKVYRNDSSLIFPSDIKIDADRTLWVLTNRFTRFLYDGLNSSEINFRIYKSSVENAVKGTKCGEPGAASVFSSSSQIVFLFLCYFLLKSVNDYFQFK